MGRLTNGAASVMSNQARFLPRKDHNWSVWRLNKKGTVMAFYMCQVSYSREALSTLIKKPHDRTKVVQAAVEKLGGKLLGFWYAFGKYDAVLIVEMPDNATA